MRRSAWPGPSCSSRARWWELPVLSCPGPHAFVRAPAHRRAPARAGCLGALPGSAGAGTRAADADVCGGGALVCYVGARPHACRLADAITGRAHREPAARPVGRGAQGAQPVVPGAQPPQRAHSLVALRAYPVRVLCGTCACRRVRAPWRSPMRASCGESTRLLAQLVISIYNDT